MTSTTPPAAPAAPTPTAVAEPGLVELLATAESPAIVLRVIGTRLVGATKRNAVIPPELTGVPKTALKIMCDALDLWATAVEDRGTASFAAPTTAAAVPTVPAPAAPVSPPFAEPVQQPTGDATVDYLTGATNTYNGSAPSPAVDLASAQWGYTVEVGGVVLMFPGPSNPDPDPDPEDSPYAQPPPAPPLLPAAPGAPAAPYLMGPSGWAGGQSFPPAG